MIVTRLVGRGQMLENPVLQDSSLRNGKIRSTGKKVTCMGSEETAVARLERLVREAESAGASDVHLHQMGGGAKVQLRLDGVLVAVESLAQDLAERVFGRIKFLARLKTYQDSLPQDGRIAKEDLGTRNDVRVSTYPTITGEKIVLRLFQSVSVRILDELGFPAEARGALEVFLRRNGGLLLLTGPAGSGKTTTIYACLRWLVDHGGRHVITVEDPVEQVVSEIMQTEVNEAAGLTFAKASKHLLRQDPEVLVIGEVRDDETAQTAVRAALTGHLVIATLHAGSCQGVIERLLVMCPDRYAVLSATALVMNQRLMRRICGSCQGKGCAPCCGSGYRGRVPLLEWLMMTDELREKIGREGALGLAPQRTLEQSAREVWEAGVSDQNEYRRMMGI